MPIRKIKQYSDRGKLSDIHSGLPEAGVNTATDLELRLSKLYDYGCKTNDDKLKKSSGFITTDYISDKNALPLSIYRLRKIVEDIKSKSGSEIQIISEQMAKCIACEIPEEIKYFARKNIFKNASINKPPVFRRVSIS
jgi:hypothetical protein